ncbi:MAG: hypothetical protein ACSHWQ_05590 [Spongiibacteraceae bacterium]
MNQGNVISKSLQQQQENFQQRFTYAVIDEQGHEHAISDEMICKSLDAIENTADDFIHDLAMRATNPPH